MKNTILLLFITIGFTSYIYACHDVNITQVDQTDNGDGTYSYTFEVCMGTGDGSETYGFYMDFTGANLIGWDNQVVGPATGNVKEANVPTINGDGVIEYGDWTDTDSPLLSDIDDDGCLNVTLTFDDIITDANLGGMQPSIGCGEVTTTIDNCFSVELQVDATVTDATDPCSSDGEITATASDGFEPYTYSWVNGQTGTTITGLEAGTYTVTITDDQGCTVSGSYTVEAPGTPDYIIDISTEDCNGDDITWDIKDSDGLEISSGTFDQNGTTMREKVCDGCGANFNITVPDNRSCDGVLNPNVEVFDGDGNSLGTATGDGDGGTETIILDCVSFLPVELKSSDAFHKENKDLNKIKWETATETNNNYFTIEHSIDGENWRIIDEISGAGNATSQRSYEIYHTSFVRDEINYYKISQIDFDGTNEEISFLSVDNRYDKKLIKTINIMGQEVNENYSGIIIKYYDDGSTVKSYR